MDTITFLDGMAGRAEQLAPVPLPAHRLWKFKTARGAHDRICELETQLGLPKSKIGFNLTVANARIRELDAMVAHVPAPKTAPLAIATPPVSDAISLAQWKAKSDGDQRSFCRDGGRLQRDAFLSMTPAAQSFFLAAGGKLEVALAPVAGPKTKNPPANSMWRSEFLQLAPQAQTAYFARGGKLHD